MYILQCFEFEPIRLQTRSGLVQMFEMTPGSGILVFTVPEFVNSVNLTGQIKTERRNHLTMF